MAEADCQWYYTRRGVTYGPFAFHRINQLVATRYLVATSLVWNASQGGDWRPVASFPEFEDALSRHGSSSVPIEPPGLRSLTELLTIHPVESARRPVMRSVIRNAWKWMVLSLFSPFRFMQWAGIAFCAWMASTYSMLGVFDEDVLLAELQAGTRLIASLLLSARQWAANVVSGQGVLSWGGMVFLVLVAACFVRAKGRLMFLHRLRFPGDSIQAAWMETNGRTLPLAVFHFIMDVLFVVLEIFTALRVFTAMDPAIVRSGEIPAIMRNILSNPASSHWLGALVAVWGVVTLVRSFSYHFLEPLYYRLHVSFGDACRLTGLLLREQGLALVSFYFFLLLFRLGIFIVCCMLAMVVALVGAPLFAILPLLLPYVIRLALLPVDFFIRSLGPRFLEAWRGFW